ncbi:hypothetical protein RHMOL_Rhmol08G0159500 [Rhododendron molle]|uniref:Uncharacterized protein n=1 Tax=Rhododendron molle TaxID=49168 RepID=A0ACC0MNS6_RHOML|nr:hypothetical protein RHMOL_Rhmol08G0159500 [Rhododendron molle]
MVGREVKRRAPSRWIGDTRLHRMVSNEESALGSEAPINRAICVLTCVLDRTVRTNHLTFHVPGQLLDSSASANADTWFLGLGLALLGYRSQFTPQRLGCRRPRLCRLTQRINSPEPKQALRSEELRRYCGGLGYELGNLAVRCDSSTRGT